MDRIAEEHYSEIIRLRDPQNDKTEVYTGGVQLIPHNEWRNPTSSCKLGFRSPEVLFCGYTIPHPAETKMHFRIQTNGPRAADILKKGIEDLEKVCDHILEVFQAEMEEFKAP
ncbi:probable DNA-directed RNA polymerases I and III subunit RPAC2 [Schistocerca americana]|uniref:probable DNA-directed RNA polymerases I and III subunit RPAC2 n=1 Tax=Schistocerca americana TaxID=7009 RepID=UPI001F503A85|nr:probable DNA-directed RNA polymerases I and III subunit RPAC2 [Schistocerca americana]